MNLVNVFGGALLDVNYCLPKEFLHKSLQKSLIELPFGEKINASSYHLNIGGSGANVAYGLHLGSIEVRFHSAISTDGIGRFIKEELKSLGFGLKLYEYDQPSALSVVIRIGGERTILTGRSQPFDMTQMEIPTIGHIHIGPLHNNDAFYEKVLEERQSSQLISFNPSIDSIYDDSAQLKKLVRESEILFVNQKEASALTHLSSNSPTQELVNALLEKGPKLVCLTCGERGAYLGDGRMIYYTSALTDSSNRVDATGAGDAFSSGFLIGYLTGKKQKIEKEELYKRSLAFGNLNAASTLAKEGAQNGLMTLRALERERHYVKIKRIV